VLTSSEVSEKDIPIIGDCHGDNDDDDNNDTELN